MLETTRAGDLDKRFALCYEQPSCNGPCWLHLATTSSLGLAFIDILNLTHGRGKAVHKFPRFMMRPPFMG